MTRTLSSSASKWIVLGLTSLALVLRLWGAGFGLPQEYHIDEHFYYPYAWTMGQGSLVLPDQSHGPSLYLGLLLIGQKTMQLAFFPQLSNAEFGALRDTNPWPFLLSARVISAILGALTVPIVFLLAQRFRNRTLGVIAAALMTVLFFHVRDSHFGVPDTLTTLFAAVTVWLSLRAFQTRRLHDLLGASLFAGLATAAKYTTVVVAVVVIVAALLTGAAWRGRVKLLVSAALGMVAGFIIGYPNLVLNPAIFIKDISFLFARVGAGYEGWRIVPDNSALFYLDTLLWSIGLAAIILTGVGLIAALARRRAEDLILISFPAAYFVVMSLSQGHFGRYMLPLLPMLAVLAADAAWYVVPQLVRRLRTPVALKAAQPIGLAALLLVFVPNLLNSLRFDWLLTQADTRTQAKRWIEANIEAGSRIAVEWPYHTPPLSNGYVIPPESTRDYWIDLVYGFGLADRPIKQYQTDGTQYLVATNYIRDLPVIDPRQEARRQQFYAELPHVFETVQSFSPRCDGGEPKFIFDSLYGPAIDLWNLCYAGPHITIYRVR